MAGLARDAAAEDQRVPRPGPPLPRLVRAAEEDDRERPGRGRQVRRAGVGADEQVGPLQQGGRLGDRQAARPVAEAVVRLEVASERARSRRPRPPRSRQPSSRNRPTRARHERGRPAWPRCPRPGGRPAGEPARRTGRRGASRARRRIGRSSGQAAGRCAGLGVAVAADGRPGVDLGPAQAAARRGQASASRRATATRSSSVTWTSTRAAASGDDPQPVEQGQPRADLVPAGNPLGDVGQQERPAAHRPADAARDAGQRQHEHASGCRRARRCPGRSPRREAAGPGSRPPRAGPSGRAAARTRSARPPRRGRRSGRPRRPRGCSARRARRSRPPG